MSVSESFIRNPDCFNCDNISDVYPVAAIKAMHEKARRPDGLQQLSNADCIGNYAEMIQTYRRNVLLVAADDKFPPADQFGINASYIYGVSQVLARDAGDPIGATRVYDWICSNDPLGNDNIDTTGSKKGCTALVDNLKKVPESWKVKHFYRENGIESIYDKYDVLHWSPNITRGPFDVQYCLSEPAEQQCKLQFTLPIAILVTILNLFKAVLIFYTAFATKEEPLMTMGDAVVSFLEKEDLTTKGMCLLSLKDVKKYKV